MRILSKHLDVVHEMNDEEEVLIFLDVGDIVSMFSADISLGDPGSSNLKIQWSYDRDSTYKGKLTVNQPDGTFVQIPLVIQGAG